MKQNRRQKENFTLWIMMSYKN